MDEITIKGMYDLSMIDTTFYLLPGEIVLAVSSISRDEDATFHAPGASESDEAFTDACFNWAAEN